jgi:hypothetical protein
VLRSFRLGNHRSFADECELLLMPSWSDSDVPVVPVTAIFGANASGKSNLLQGLGFMRHAVLQSFSRWDDEGIPREPFRLGNGDRTKPSVFVVELIIDGVRYTYGFELDDVIVLAEWLHSYPEGRKRKLFERSGSDISFGSTVRGDLHAKLEVLEELIRPNALFLSACARLNLDVLMPVYRWFRHQLRTRFGGGFGSYFQVAERVADLLERDPRNSERLVSLLAAADVGITDLVVKKSKDHQAAVELDRIAERIAQTQAALKAEPDDGEKLAARLADLRFEQRYLRRRADRERVELAFLHGDSDEAFRISEESAGTRSWLELLPMVLEALDSGLVVVVDEIDTSLHPLLTARLIDLFRNRETNPHSAQLIFTSHDTSLLGTMLGDEVLGRDQVWFVEKAVNGASALYPLTDFKPRNDQNTERRYLSGSYGAIPVLDQQDFIEAVRPR